MRCKVHNWGNVNNAKQNFKSVKLATKCLRRGDRVIYPHQIEEAPASENTSRSLWMEADRLCKTVKLGLLDRETQQNMQKRD